MDAELIARLDRRVPRYTSYPTAPHFSPEVDADVYAGWLAAIPAAEVLSLYVHVPFCHELCLYCGCHTTVARRYGPVGAYVGLVEREVALVADRLGSARPVSHIHWGGGTPTILSPRDLVGLMRALGAAFDIRRDADIAIEIDPRSLEREHVAAMTEVGVNRASLGVQDFDETVQRAINRIQTFERTAEVAGWLREAGITALNLDLMYGLPHQSARSVARSVARALELEPARIALFGYAHVPWMKRHQALLPEEHLPGAAERFAQMRAAAEVIRAAGYVAIGLDHFARPDDSLVLSQEAGRLHRNFQGYTSDQASTLIGFGTSSIGALPQGYVQNAPSTVAYRGAVEAGRLATVRGVALSPEDRLRRAIIERLMCDLAVDLERVVGDHGEEPARFLPELASIDAMAGDGVVARDGYRITIPDDARPFLRNVCAVFDTNLREDEARHSRAV